MIIAFGINAFTASLNFALYSVNGEPISLAAGILASFVALFCLVIIATD